MARPGNTLEFEKHPFLLGRFWCTACAAAYTACPLHVEGQALTEWPADQDGSGTLCSICGHGNKEVLVCDGPCRGYFVTCESCAVNISGRTAQEVETCFSDDSKPFHCMFCQPGGRSKLRVNSFRWLRRNKLFLRDVRKRWKRMKRSCEK
jgi:hypothetical protein